MTKPTLNAEDQARVDSYLQGAIHTVDRQPFRPWLLLGIIVAVLTALSFLSYGIAWWHGVV